MLPLPPNISAGQGDGVFALDSPPPYSEPTGVVSPEPNRLGDIGDKASARGRLGDKGETVGGTVKEISRDL